MLDACSTCTSYALVSAAVFLRDCNRGYLPVFGNTTAEHCTYLLWMATTRLVEILTMVNSSLAVERTIAVVAGHHILDMFM